MRQYDLSSISILVVDDNRHFLAIMRTMLRAFGAQKVFECTDAIEALELLKETEIDIVFVDWKLPEVDGLEFSKLLRSAPDSQNPHIPIILISAYRERSLVEAAIRAGVDEFLGKPVSANILYERIVWLIDNPRPYLRIGSYFGPDRRRRVDPRFTGQDRRARGPEATA